MSMFGTTVCIQCNVGLAFIEGKFVLSSCDKGEFGTLTGCVAFPSQCSECDSQLTCTACAENFTLVGPMCVKSCADGQYGTLKDCFNCPTNCATCDSEEKYLDCTGTSIGLVNGRCVLSNCIDGQYESFCYTCIKDYCITLLNTCRKVCAEGKYPDQNDTCINCPVNCLICFNATMCSDCDLGYTPVKGTCIQNCKETTQFLTLGECKACPEGCLSCLNLEICIQCDTQNNFTMIENKCVKACKPGTFGTPLGCELCPKACVDCTSPFQCDSCADGYTMIAAGVCVMACDIDQFGNKTGCTDCSGECSTCIGPHMCLQCANESFT
jgi:proprotein convertase subtilisin/kexin type 5